MSKLLIMVAVSAIGATGLAQSFECYPVGPLPMDPAVSCEGVVSNNLGAAFSPTGATGVDNVATCGFPTAGLNYLRIVGNGPANLWNPPIGGPFTRPVPALVTEVRIPIPGGSSAVGMQWDFFSRECQGVPPANNYYDGMSIDVVDAGGNFIMNLAYADTASPEGTCSVGTDYCSGPMSEILPNGPNILTSALPALPNCAYISIVVWNGYDNAYPSFALVDNIQFNSGLPACPVPCFIAGNPVPVLAFSSPSGSGCILATMTTFPSGGIYFMPVTLTPGAYPNGWFFGLDIAFTDLANLIGIGYPFIGPVGGSGCGGGVATVGEFCGLPSGLSVWAVGLGAPAGSSYPSVFTAPATYTIP